MLATFRAFGNHMWLVVTELDKSALADLIKISKDANELGSVSSSVVIPRKF